MRPEDEPRFAELLDALASLFSRELDGPAIALYWAAVQEMTIKQFETAVGQAAISCSHFPPPVELRTLVGEVESVELRAAEAWPEVLRLASRSSGDHSDPTARAAIILMGGGKALGQRQQEDLGKWGKKEFIDHYVELAAKGSQQMLGAAKPSGLLPGGLGFE